MDMRRLEAFSKVYELGSFSKAGQQLYLSQPTISAHVALLEQELGAPLFDRLGRTVLPTPAGEVLYRHTRKAMSALDEAKAEVELLRERISGELIVGGSSIPANYLLPDLMARFQARHPAVRFRLATGDSGAIIERILTGELVLGIVGALEDDPDLVFEPIVRDELIIVAAPAKAKGLSGVGALLAWPWIVREHGSGTRRAFELAVRKAGMEPRDVSVVAAVESNEAAMHCARAGLGVTVSSRLAALSLLRSGELVEVEVPELTIERMFYSVHGKRRHVFPAYRAFIEFLKTVRPNEAARAKDATSGDPARTAK